MDSADGRKMANDVVRWALQFLYIDFSALLFIHSMWPLVTSSSQ